MRVTRADDSEPRHTAPQFEPMRPLPGMEHRRPRWIAYIAGRFGKGRASGARGPAAKARTGGNDQ